MIIPSIDIRDGKAVQLRQGRDLVLTDDRDPIELAREFNRYGPVAVIDLDAALGTGDNLELIEQICRVAEVRVGGGIRDVERGKRLLRAGAQKLIIGSAATPEFLSQFNPDHIIVALDHKGMTVVDKGWTASTGERVLDRGRRLAPYCSGYLCTFVEVEGTMQGLPMVSAFCISDQLPHPVTFAGGIDSTDEAIHLCREGLDVQVGMALYTGKLDLDDVIVGSMDFEKMNGLIPTVVQDDRGQFLMQAYSSPESLQLALLSGKGTYFSRSRQQIWEKGATSGNTQKLLTCRADCDRDALVFTVEQTGHACHCGSYSCACDKTFDIRDLLFHLEERLRERPEDSYTIQLADNPEKLFKKLLEEAFELSLAKTPQDQQWEIADLLYHVLVYMAVNGISWDQIISELRSRHK